MAVHAQDVRHYVHVFIATEETAQLATEAHPDDNSNSNGTNYCINALSCIIAYLSAATGQNLPLKGIQYNAWPYSTKKEDAPTPPQNMFKR